MFRKLGLLLLAGALISAAILAGCTAQGELSLKEILRKEGFNLSGHSDRPLRSTLLVFRELEADDRPH